ncbi:hypothetical protein D3C81_1825740 [compost metagenome]
MLPAIRFWTVVAVPRVIGWLEPSNIAMLAPFATPVMASRVLVVPVAPPFGPAKVTCTLFLLEISQPCSLISKFRTLDLPPFTRATFATWPKLLV